MATPFRVGVTRDFLKPDGTLGFGDINLGLLDANPQVTWEFLAENTAELRADQVRDYDALLVLSARVTAATLAEAERLAIVARFGVGYDTVDVDACTRAGAILTITPDGVRRPVAHATIAFIMALSTQMFAKDRITRAGRWDDRFDFIGLGLGGRTLGLVGLGNIGRDVINLIRPFGMRHLAFDPYTTPEAAAEIGVELVDLDTVLRTSDFISIHCPLNEQTQGLINAERLALMKPSAYLINTARGPIVDQAALTAALRDHRIAGAGIDVFEREPVDPGDPLLTLDNVIVAPHALCFTDEVALGNGGSACRSILDVAAGRVPTNVVNRAAIDSPAFQAKLARQGAVRPANSE
jgi:D-3-phosphoglycerate dehydrogenase